MIIQLHKCKACNVRMFSEYQIVRIERFGPGSMYERNIYGRINEFGREVSPSTDLRACPACSKVMSMSIIQGRVTDTACDHRCTEAKGHKCECSCGGKNHGRAA